MQKFSSWLQKRWHICSGCCFLLSAAVLLCLLLNAGQTAASGNVQTQPTEKLPAKLADFTIVADADSMAIANELAVNFKVEYNISLPVVEADKFTGTCGIYVDATDFNSYGGYKYGISWEETDEGAALYVNGSGKALETAVEKFLKNFKDPSVFPFGLEEPVTGYEWDASDVNMTALGYGLQETTTRELCEGIELRELKYKSFAYGTMEAYVVVVKAGAQAEMKVVTGEWDENTTADNPATKYTVEEYAEKLQEEGYEVLAITNGGFYDLNTGKTNIPWGMQIVDGAVQKAPSTENPKYTDNWVGLAVDGKYVISDTAGYKESYEGRLVQGIGGGLVLMRDGVPCISATSVDYRTAVGVTANGDLAVLTVPSANYAVIAQIFMDLDLDITEVLNLDGGGSTTLHTLSENGTLQRFLCETPLEREVADAIAIVKKK